MRSAGLLAAWTGFALLLAVLPLVFASPVAVTILNQMGISIVFALSYNMLLGQGGMLSFGHAAYFGLGGFFAVHVMNGVDHHAWPIPLPVLPVLGGVFGFLFALVIGSFSTRRAGTVFAMISLGIGELIAACSIILVVFFGGEEGVSADRTMGPEVLGHDFVSEIEVYVLTAAIVFAATGLMYLFSRTPAGRMANAVRDNAERAEFLGYSQRMVRFISFCASGFFAGVAGGLFAINYEILTEENLSLAASGWVLLMAYIGGVGYFVGPIVGAVLLTLLQTVLSVHTDIWRLYLGILFLLTVMYLPTGLTGLLMMHGPAWQAGRLGRLAGPYARASLPLLALVAGVIALLEMAHHLNAGGSAAAVWTVFGAEIALAAAWPWLLAAGLVVLGSWGLRRCLPELRAAWGEARVTEAAVAMTAALSLRQVAKSFGMTEIIRGVDLEVEAGERHAIIGPNGAGKSTLFHLISGRHGLSDGSIALNGIDITGMAPYEIARLGLSRSFQVTNIFPRLSVFENVRSAMLWTRGYRYSFWHLIDRQHGLNDAVDAVLADIGLEGRRDVPAGILAYAEQRALEIAITVASGADVIMLDEPTSGMSRAETAAMVELIRRVTEGRTLLMVEHDMGVVFDLADRISVLVYGRIIATGPPDEIRANPEVQEAYLGSVAAP